MRYLFLQTLILAFYFLSSHAFAISVIDDSGKEVYIKTEATRIVALAPHIVEQLYAIGAGDRIVGTVNHSDYPEAAKHLPVIGGYNRFDLESILALKPDLIIGWVSGNSSEQIEQLKNMGITLFLDEPRKIGDIAKTMDRLGILTGQHSTTLKATEEFKTGFLKLHKQYRYKRRLRIFYQLWHQPLMTINGKQIINDILDQCGGENIFKNLSALTPVISREAVIAANPEVIITTGMHDERIESQAEWKTWSSLQAVKNKNLYSINPDLIHRASPRLLSGARHICAFIEQARNKQTNLP